LKFSIKTNGLGKRFNREWIFRKLNYSFEGPGLYAITGPNGSGKSTLMQVLWGQSLPTAGNLQYFAESGEVEVTEVFRHIAIATPYMDLIDEFTLDEQLDFHFKIKTIRTGFAIQDLPEIMYLGSSKNKQIGNFSSGMRQRLKLAIAFYTQAEVIFLDEPGTNLDKQAFQWYLNQLQKVQPFSLIIIASNNPEEYPGAEVINVSDWKIN
jgi:ABC-type multidrug transport system ATPase subunit